MIDYLYDGTFEGFLTCVYHHYYTDKASGIFKAEEYQSTMLGGYLQVATEKEKTTRVYRAIQKKISDYDLRRTYKVFLSSMENKEIKLLHYLRLGFHVGSKVSLLHGNPIVFEIQKTERKVNAEIHRMYGLVRFSALDNGVMYSHMDTDHDILEFMADHFTDRFKNQPFILHDIGRKKALIAYGGSWYLTYFTKEDVPDIGQEERVYRQLWKQYFENIAIKERTNPRCQKNMMPVRYWKHLTEKTTVIPE